MNGQIAVSVKTAAALVDASETTIRDEINRQNLPAFRVGRGIRILVRDLEDWCHAQVRVGHEDD